VSTTITDRVVSEELDKITRAACDLVRGIELLLLEGVDGNFYSEEEALDWARKYGYIGEETLQWIKTHKASDKKKKEDLKVSALAKLTAEEKEALGL
jgi:hypothetical protein